MRPERCILEHRVAERESKSHLPTIRSRNGACSKPCDCAVDLRSPAAPAVDASSHAAKPAAPAPAATAAAKRIHEVSLPKILPLRRATTPGTLPTAASCRRSVTCIVDIGRSRCAREPPPATTEPPPAVRAPQPQTHRDHAAARAAATLPDSAMARDLRVHLPSFFTSRRSRCAPALRPWPHDYSAYPCK